MPRYEVRKEADSWCYVVWDTHEDRWCELCYGEERANRTRDALNAAETARTVTETLAPDHPNADRAERRIVEDLR